MIIFNTNECQTYRGNGINIIMLDTNRGEIYRCSRFSFKPIDDTHRGLIQLAQD